MISFLINAAIVLVFLFVLVVIASLMTWVVVKLLRFLFPNRFNLRTADFPCGETMESKR